MEKTKKQMTSSCEALIRSQAKPDNSNCSTFDAMSKHERKINKKTVKTLTWDYGKANKTQLLSL